MGEQDQRKEIPIRSWAAVQRANHRILYQFIPRGIPATIILYLITLLVAYGMLCLIPLVGDAFRFLFLPWGVCAIGAGAYALASTWRPAGRTPLRHCKACFRSLVRPACTVGGKAVFPQKKRWKMRGQIVTIRPGTSWPDVIPANLTCRSTALIRVHRSAGTVVPAHKAKRKSTILTVHQERTNTPTVVKLDAGETLKIRSTREERVAGKMLQLATRWW